MAGCVAMVIKGTTIEGDDKTKTVALRSVRPSATTAASVCADAGLTLAGLGGQLQIGQVKFGSRAQKSGFEQGWDVQHVLVPTDRPNAHWFYLPALLLCALVWWRRATHAQRPAHSQRRRGMRMP